MGFPLPSQRDPLVASQESRRIRGAYAKRLPGAARYSWFDDGHLFIVQQLERRLLRAIRRRGLAPLRSRTLLEIGCGNGHWLREFIKWGATPENLTGIDLLAERVVLAKRLSPPGVKYEQADAAQLSFRSESFDIVLQATVFTSILDAQTKASVAAEMLRVVKPRGLILWYDFYVNNPNNPDVRGVSQREIARLFPSCRIDLETVTLAPPIARRLAPISWTACDLLAKLPWLCTHYLGSIQKCEPISKHEIPDAKPIRND
ncbi:MAG TPA: class I SAM-dependent methyltransferase [Candidatus Eisenbacteria bacterium]|nr:class I SAM-dependent methyltransferase [Candidatus Eisenbacteria bacterium]